MISTTIHSEQLPLGATMLLELQGLSERMFAFLAVINRT